MQEVCELKSQVVKGVNLRSFIFLVVEMISKVVEEVVYVSGVRREVVFKSILELEES